MNTRFQVSFFSRRLRTAFSILLAITLLNYIAQIPYYIHFYFVYHAPPSLFGLAFLLATLVLFLVGYIWMMQGKRLGSWLLLLFLVLEFGGYLLHNLSGAFLKDLPTSDPLFLTISLIGYLNFVVAFVYLVILLKNRYPFLLQPRYAQNGMSG